MSSNAYESGQQKIIPAVLLYAFHQDSVLMIHKNSNPNDFHNGKWNGLGGKLEVGENFIEAATREFSEEATLKTSAEQWKWTGQLFFPNFKAHKKEDWMVNVYTIDLNAAQAAAIPVNESTTPEGSLHFVAREKIMDLNLWDGDQHFLPHVLKNELFNGAFFYENGKCTRFTLQKLNLNR